MLQRLAPLRQSLTLLPLLACRLEEMYDAQEGPDDIEEDSDFDPAMVMTLTGSDLEGAEWEEVCF